MKFLRDFYFADWRFFEVYWNKFLRCELTEISAGNQEHGLLRELIFAVFFSSSKTIKVRWKAARIWNKNSSSKSTTPFLILNFLDFHVYVVMSPIFPANQRRCASSSKNVAILSLWSKGAIIAPNNLIDSQHYKQGRSQYEANRGTCLSHFLVIFFNKAWFQCCLQNVLIINT